MDRAWFILGVGLIAIGAVSGFNEIMKAEYERGYKAGADSLSDKQVDQACIQWLFHADLEAARRRVCGK